MAAEQTKPSAPKPVIDKVSVKKILALLLPVTNPLTRMS